MINFGIYENLIKNWEKDLQVVSIIGRQSSGKSYFLNRVFGTRFNVSANRCTDGIWMSVSIQQDENGIDKYFVILDCEGLFSVRRTQEEEIKLLLTLSSISDIMILNNDLSFNRNIDQLFDKIKKVKGKLKGKKLFKGDLFIMIRDVSADEDEKAKQEFNAFLNNKIQDENNFIDKIFNNYPIIWTLCYFKQPDFAEYLENIKQHVFFKNNKKRWLNGNQFLNNLKIILSQVFIEDDSDMDRNKFKIICEQSLQKFIKVFFNDSEYYKNLESYFIYTSDDKELKISNADINLEFLQDNKIQEEEFSDIDFSQSSKSMKLNKKQKLDQKEKNIKIVEQKENSFIEISNELDQYYLQNKSKILNDYDSLKDSKDVLKDDDSKDVLKDDDSQDVLKNDDSKVVLKDNDSKDVLKKDDSKDVLKNDDSKAVLKDDDSKDVLKDDDSKDVLKDDDSDDMINKFLEQSSQNEEYQSISEKEQQIQLENNQIEEKENQLYKIFQQNFSVYKIEDHNLWTKHYKKFNEQFILQRIQIAMQGFEKAVSVDDEFKSDFQLYQQRLQLFLDQFKNNFIYCQKTCRKCDRNCVKLFNHKKNCLCKTNHLCTSICKVTENCIKQKYMCSKIFGHSKDHLCSFGKHICNQPCDVSDCNYFCMLKTDHQENTHDCNNKHPCKFTCENEKCKRSCFYDIINKHDKHDCGDQICIYDCCLCPKKCSFKNHFHQELINVNDSELKIKLNDFLENEKEEDILMNYHICKSEHICKIKCEKEGICNIQYDILEKEFDNGLSKFKYKFFKPKQAKDQCVLQIPYLKQKHEEKHKCGMLTHQCTEQCPECKSYCSKTQNHTGLHFTNIHRNKENCFFISKKNQQKIEFKDKNKNLRIYEIGENCKPEICNESCERKGRSHYHLLECPGFDKCPSLFNNKIKHSTDKYYPYESKIYDLWLCQAYWKSFNWEMPLEDKEKEIINGCNFMCDHFSHKNVSNYSYCDKEAWHDGEHQFICIHPKVNYSIIDICFVCDATGSMSPYLNQAKIIINEIIQKFENTQDQNKRDFKFGVVFYRDHPPERGNWAKETKKLDFSDKQTAQVFIKGTNVGGGGNAEASLDGLHEAVNLKWRKDSLKYLFHIADQPPHGKQYAKGRRDRFPNGCPKGYNIEKISQKMNDLSINYKFLKIGNLPNEQDKIFSEKIKNYELKELDSAIELSKHVTSCIERDLFTNQLDLIVKQSLY